MLVDEYQDTNVAQYLWLRLLAQKHTTSAASATTTSRSMAGAARKSATFCGSRRIFRAPRSSAWNSNYRSTPHILAAASGLIAANKGRLGKTLWTEAASGERVKVSGSGTARRKPAGSAKRSRRCSAHRGSSTDPMAVLVRASFQMRAFEERFITLGLPYRVIGGPRFYERQEIRDAHGLSAAGRSPTDDLAFERIVNVPKRGLGDTALQKIQHDRARAKAFR